MNDQAISVTLLAVTSSVGVFTSLLPPLSEVRKSKHDADTTNDVRMGELAAAGLTLAIGLMASALVKNPAPAMIAVLCAGGLVVMYESVLSTPPKEAKA